MNVIHTMNKGIQRNTTNNKPVPLQNKGTGAGGKKHKLLRKTI